MSLTLLATFLSGCVVGVRQQDLDAWAGQPVVALETHPVFITIPVVKTVASDGTEIWNYVNGADISNCSGIANGRGNSSVNTQTHGSSVQGNRYDSVSYKKFSNCMSRFAACNNLFYIKDGVVIQYNPIGTGGARCYTNKSVQPHFRGSTNIR